MRYLILSMLCLTLALFGCQKTDPEGVNQTIYVDHDYAKMPVYIRGNVASGKLILLIHGGPGGSGLEYRGGTYTEMLEEEFAVAYWDQRGQGMSQGTFHTDFFTIDQMVEDMKAVILSLRAKYGDALKVYVLGHSWGGTLGTAFMIKKDYQHLCSGWIESNGAHDIPKLNVEAIKMFRQVAAEEIAEGRSVDEWTEIKEWADGIDTLAISLETGGDINQKGFEVEQILGEDGVIGGDEIIFPDLYSPTNYLTSFLTGNVTSSMLLDEVEMAAYTDSLDQITIPSLFLWGKCDFVVPPALGFDAFNRVSSADKEIVIYNRSGHSPMAYEGEAYASDIIEFVNRVD
jgi:pimeloyl-ACP methyl ester carboxylesterase